jgi:hypothetical protein
MIPYLGGSQPSTCTGMWSDRVASQLQEQPILNLGDFHGRRASLVVVRDLIDPTAHGIAPHQPSFAGLQQFGRRSYIRHPRIEPEVVVMWTKDDWHAVMDR